MHAERTDRSKRRADVLYTVADNDSRTCGYIAYCLNYGPATVMRDLHWLKREGYVSLSGFLWSVTEKGRDYLRTEDDDA